MFLLPVTQTGRISTEELWQFALAVRFSLPRKDLASQITDLVESAQTSYTLTFDPTLAVEPDEYHRLKIEVRQPGFTVHTSTGYYDQPFYSDPPDPQITQVAVAQLEERVLHGTRSRGSAARPLSSLALTERLTQEKLQGSPESCVPIATGWK